MFFGTDPEDYLLSSERRVIRVRLHWAVMLPYALQTFFALIITMGLSSIIGDREGDLWLVHTVLWYAALFMVLRFAYHLLEWWLERLVVTDRRMMRTHGILTNNVEMMPITKVTDLSYRRSLTGLVLGFGTLVVESAGQVQALNEIPFLPRPEEVYDAISELVFGEKGMTRAPSLTPPRRRFTWGA